MKNFMQCMAALVLTTSPVFQTNSCAQAGDSDYYAIKSESFSVTEAGSAKEMLLEQPAMFNTDSKQLATATALVNTGIAAWNVVSGGSPSGAASSAYASALPPAIFLNWSGVAQWKGPKEYFYSYTVTNLMNIDVIKVKYKISFFYGGTEDYAGRHPGPKDVTGKYITNFTVKAVSVNVKWGWHFNLDVKMSNPMNVGTTKKPVAALQSDLQWSVSNILSTNSGIWSYTLDGNGNFRDLNAEEKSLTKAIPLVQPLETPAVSWN
ncbi:MAG: hypothetical protein A2234_07240 [Elusimicrobia bacterium RIFOXYA2_FULL_58_8]|nr:MAG: hypothetical protein A2234_07240 [Elusimicrobia bacterium RIFOXYA2_FULL_58_8]